MSHLVKPVSFRVGKTYLWDHNVLLNTRLKASSLTTGRSLDRVTEKILKRKRLYFVKGAISGSRNNILQYKLIFAPKIKTKPREYRIGAFLKRGIYRKFSTDQFLLAKEYVQRRREKIVKFSRPKQPQLNKWLSRRMFRGSCRFIWKRRTHRNRFLLSSRNKRISRKKIRYFLANYYNPNGRDYMLRVRAFYRIPRRIAKRTQRKIHKKYRLQINRYRKWKLDKRKSRRFNNKAFSAQISSVIKKNISIKALNVFSYLANKNIIHYKTHQRHLWNFKYRRFRFRYKNYFDIVNSFFLLSKIDCAESFLFSVLKITLPLILKIKRFFKFLDVVIQNMPELRNKYSVLKLAITGKLAGGTKRTKAHSIGYGILPIQTLAIHASNNFLSYTHIYGEFGVKLLICKNSEVREMEKWK